MPVMEVKATERLDGGRLCCIEIDGDGVLTVGRIYSDCPVEQPVLVTAARDITPGEVVAYDPDGATPDLLPAP